MKLIDLLEKIDESSNVMIWEDNEVVSSYDGKNSIDEKYNDREVESISVGYFLIDIEIEPLQ
jgi:hypothetical protein